nr:MULTISPECIES: glycosyltransferase family 4 protein [unclassified Mesorhizobium]
MFQASKGARMLREKPIFEDYASTQCALSIVLILLGRLSSGRGFVSRIADILRPIVGKVDNDVELIVVFSDPQWKTIPALQSLPSYFRRVRVCEVISENELPAVLFNAGRKIAVGHRLIFLGPQLAWDVRRLPVLLEASRTATRNNQSIALSDTSSNGRYGLVGNIPKSQLHGWVLNCPFLSLSDLAISATALDEIGGFDPSPLVQQASCWDALIRLSCSHEISIIKVEGGSTSDGRTPFITRPYPVSEDMRRRYMASGLFAASAQERERNFIQDLAPDDASYLCRHIPSLARAAGPSASRPLRVTITGGLWEYHHNWLCFFSYFKHLEGTGFGTYKPVFDHLVTREDIENSDVVILSRCKVEQVRQILDWCKDLDIPSIYMIDDNWITVAEDWPDPYRNIFGPETQFFKNFVFGIKHADYVLTYNRLLADDIAPYAKRIVTLPNSVDLALFEKTPRRHSKRFVIGYSGSDRYDDRAFRALAQIAKTHDDVDLLIFGNLSAEQRAFMSGARAIEYSGVSYIQYAQMIREASPDILLAPLDATRTSRSKCPNKYLEITAAGAVGVYSNLEPYSWHIDDGINGVLVSDPDDWTTPIISLLDKKKLLRMHASARADVAKNYDATVVAPQFADLIRSIASGLI